MPLPVFWRLSPDMAGWRSAIHGLRNLFSRRTSDRETEAEVQHYFEMTVDDYVRNGMKRDEAERAARLHFGSPGSVREEVRTSGWENVVETLVDDVRYASRRLRNNTAFTAVAVISLALGIGANTAIFSVVNAVLVKPLPFSHPEQLTMVMGGSGALSYPEYEEIRDHNTVFSDITALAPITGLLSTGDDTHLINGVIVSGSFFNVLGVDATHGRLLTPADDQQPGAHAVAMISDRFWKAKFGGREDIAGLNVRYNGQALTIVGVLPAGFAGPLAGETFDIYVPMMMQALARPPRAGYSGEMNADLLRNRRNHWLAAIGRLKVGTTAPQALAQLGAMVEEQEHISPSNGMRLGVGAVTLLSEVNGEQRNQVMTASRLLLTVVGVVLLIACVNVANLTLAQGTTRRKEIALRLAIGASRARLIRQLLTESVLLAMCGGVAGSAIAWTVGVALRSWPPPDGVLPIPVDFSLDGGVLAITAVLALVTGIVVGLVPAISASRRQLVPALKDESAIGTHRRFRFNAPDVLVVLQLALSLVLLITGGLFLRSFSAARAVNPGFDTSQVATTSLSVDILKYTRVQGRTFYRQLIEHIEADPSVQSASLSRWVPLTGNGSVRGWSIQGAADPGADFRSEGGNTTTAPPNTINVNTVSTRWFETMGIAIVRGRDFAETDDTGSAPVVIVNEEFVRRHMKSMNPLGQRISFRQAAGPWHEVVGVVRNIKVNSITKAVEPLAFVPLLQNHETGVTLYVRSKGSNASTVVPLIKREVRALDSNLPISGVRPLQETVDATLYASRVGARLLLGFGVVALLLATVGMCGLVSYGVSRRTREFGVRMALGAKPFVVMQGVVNEAAVLAALGIAVGLATAIGATRLLRSFLYGVTPNDGLTFASLALLMFVVAVVASIGPAWRAMRVDSIKALRAE